MAIRFVDVEPEVKAVTAEGKAKAAGRPTKPAPPSTPEPATVGSAAPSETPAAESAASSGLTLPKPEPKARGRRAPVTPAAVAEPPEPEARGTTPDADGLLPGLQLHAKPTPKPRGRKKAFG